MRRLEPGAEHAYALLRMAAGFMFSLHGAGKILGILSMSPAALGSQLWLGGLIELIGGFLIMVGCQTRAAAFLCSGTMAVAYIQFHWKFRFGPEFFPIVNQGELAALYSFVFLYIACRGGVKWGLDGLARVDARRSRHLSVFVDRPVQEVCAFASDPENLPKWATGLGTSVKREGEELVADSPMGRIRICFAPKNDAGILDHDVTLPTGVVGHNPMRVMPNGSGSEVVFTLLAQPGMTEAQFAQDAAWVQKDLELLKRLLEPGSNPPSPHP